MNSSHRAGPASQGAHAHAASLDTALDFVNTLEYEDGVPVDAFQTTRSAVEWLRERGLVHDERARDDERLGQIRAARDALRELIDAAAEQRTPSAPAVREANHLLRAREVLELVLDGDGVTLGHVHLGDPIEDALARLADPIARAVSGEQRERLRICANDECRYVFEDTSRTGRRRWCDMASCGNRAKAARHRARAKAERMARDEPGTPATA